jgi:hypothetical protein
MHQLFNIFHWLHHAMHQLFNIFHWLHHAMHQLFNIFHWLHHAMHQEFNIFHWLHHAMHQLFNIFHWLHHAMHQEFKHLPMAASCCAPGVFCFVLFFLLQELNTYKIFSLAANICTRKTKSLGIDIHLSNKIHVNDTWKQR